MSVKIRLIEGLGHVLGDGEIPVIEGNILPDIVEYGGRRFVPEPRAAFDASKVAAVYRAVSFETGIVTLDAPLTSPVV